MRSISILDGKVEARLYGIADAETELGIRPDAEDFRERIEQILEDTGSEAIVAQRLAFNDRVIDVLEQPEMLEEVFPGFLRTTEPADTVIVPTHYSTLVMNADCPQMTALIPSSNERSVSMVSGHYGLGSLYQEGKPHISAVYSLLRHFYDVIPNTDDVEIYLGDGIQPTAYVFDTTHPKWGE